MSIYLRGKVWWCRIEKYGRVWQSSLKTTDKVVAMMRVTSLDRSLTKAEMEKGGAPAKRRSGLTTEDVQTWWTAQKGRCRICKKKSDTPCVDHCHASMKVRGLLCVNCNTGLGNFKDNPYLLRKAIEYLSHTDTAKKDIT